MPMRKISKCQQELIDLIHKIAEILTLRDINYSILFGCDDIDSFHSGMFNVKIKGDLNGQRIQHSVLIKWHTNSQVRRVLREAYVRESIFYNKIVPRYLEIQRKFKIIEGLRIKFPNCILASDEREKECIVLMDLARHGYEVYSRFEKTDLHNSILAMKQLAKMHALSFVLERADPEAFAEIREKCSIDVQHANPDREAGSMRLFYDTSVEAVTDPIAKQKLKELGPHILSILYKSTLPVPHYSAICHGDCWNNNILYKYKRQRAVDIVLIDFQLTRYCSPVTDIAYFMYMSTEKSFLSENYESLLDIYYATFAAVLRECNLEVEEIYPRNIFSEHLIKYSVFGLVEALISMMIITAPSEEALKMTEIKEQFSNENFFESQSKNLFSERVNGVVDDFFARNYSLDSVLERK